MVEHQASSSDSQAWSVVGRCGSLKSRGTFLLAPAHELDPGLVRNALLGTQTKGSRFGYRYLNRQDTWPVTFKVMLALL